MVVKHGNLPVTIVRPVTGLKPNRLGIGCILSQGHPMDLFLISVLYANFCWLEHLGKMICPWKERVAGKETVQGV